MVEISEKDFEAHIESILVGAPASGINDRSQLGNFTSGGFFSRSSGEYDRSLCLIPNDVTDFIKATQPKEWQKLVKQYGQLADKNFLMRLSDEITRRGILDVLRKGIKDVGASFRMYYAKPNSALNADLQGKYLGNIFTVIRQLHFSERAPEKSLDVVIFLNGLPIFTAELKDPFTGQNVQNAIHQYQYTRDPVEPLFQFKRCLAHFAVDPDLVYFTTHLKGEDTIFLPFNRGYDGGPGNPPTTYDGYPSEYLWNQIWSKDSLLDLIQNFVHIVEETDLKGVKHTKMIFPRYHQLDAVRRLVSHARENGAGQRYLVQHSAGSGKSFSIAWLSHQLSVLHDKDDHAVFDSVIVVTDRRVLDRQLRDHIRSFELVTGVVEAIEGTSQQLKEALENGKRIIVTTLQKFPIILGTVQEMSGQHFAVIIDEAHSSQTGEAAHKMKQVLNDASLELAERDQEEQQDIQDRIIADMASRGPSKNLSLFAFTATPKAATLELFGEKRQGGGFEAFSLYPMRQAIEEGFILDVLEHYTTYRTYWQLLKTAKDDPKFDQGKANYLLKKFVDQHETTLRRKTEIIIDHFTGKVMHLMNGKAKAMLVTPSRLHAVRYKLLVDEYIREKNLSFYSLVAFSGTVVDDQTGEEFTETRLNTSSVGESISESQTAEVFKEDRFRIMIVAEKFQTGFDQPLLHTMYVDKRLKGLHAVQTLSRLNRTHTQKETPFVLDFVNDTDSIREAFQPYYDRTFLDECTDPNLLYTYERQIMDYAYFTSENLEDFAAVYWSPKARQQDVINVLNPVKIKLDQLDKEERRSFKDLLRKYVRAFSYISQLVSFQDADLERLYQFSRLLVKLIHIDREELPTEITDAINLHSLKVKELSEGSITLSNGKGELPPLGEVGERGVREDELEYLSTIIKELNRIFGTEFSRDDILPVLQNLEASLYQDNALRTSVKINSEANARLTFDVIIEDLFQNIIDTNFKMYKMINDNPEMGKWFKDTLFDRYKEHVKKEPGELL